jgi:putative transposase
MGRKPRIYFPGAFYHVINRGNQRRKIYWDTADYEHMLRMLQDASQRYQLLVHAYCLMPNHFHLLAEVGEHPLELAMKSAETSYARYFNRRHRKIGHVFQARYRAILCDKSSYLLELIRYIHLNPVRAKLVNRPEEWSWSSHRSYVGLTRTEWLYQTDVLAFLGCAGRSKPAGRSKMVEFFEEAGDLKPRPEFYRPENYPLLGGQEFVSRIPPAQEPRRRQENRYRGPRLSLEEIAARLAQAEEISAKDLKGAGGGYRMSRLRDEVVYAALHFFFYRAIKVAQFLRLSASAVTYSHRRTHRRLESQPEQVERIQRLLRLPR